MFQALRATHDDASLLVMSANNDDRDTVRKWDLAQDKSVAFNSVASSAGSTATMAVVVQSAMGHLNGWPSYPFDQEECYARATVAATRSQSLTVILSQIDMMGIIGMIQVLAARAHLAPSLRPPNKPSDWATFPLTLPPFLSVDMECMIEIISSNSFSAILGQDGIETLLNAI